MNINLEKLRQNWCGVKILILGFAREGRNNFRFLRKLFPKKVIGIADKKELRIKNKELRMDRGVRLYSGKNYLKALKDYDVVIKSPGIPFKILPKSVLKKITTQTEIFLNNCPGKIVGVAGTKGKSTTASLIYKVLKAGGKRTHLVGNIGKPVLSFLFKTEKDKVFVYELSSFQLMNLKKNPQIAVLLNTFPDHLDYHKDLNEYVQANANIARYQSKNDFLIYNSEDKLVKEIAKKSPAKKIPIRGVYYDLNKNAARAVGKIFKIPKIIIEKAVREFKPLPHRLEYVGTFKGIKFYNDALSTVPETTIAALDILGDNVETIFLGGFDRGLSFDGLAKRIIKSNIKTLILFPTTGRHIKQAIENFQFPISNFQYFFVDNMKDAVKLAYEHTSRGKICLLSTASASFSIFRDYKEKGNLFKKYVRKMGRSKKIFF